MHFGYTRIGGVWIAGTVLLAAEMADIDAKLYKAINGDDGGDWSPAAIISLAGAGLRLYGAPFRLYDSLGPAIVLDFDDGTGLLSMQSGMFSVTTAATMQVEGPFNLTGTAVVTDAAARTCTGAWDLNAGAWEARTGHTFRAYITAGAYQFDNACSFTGTLGCSGPASFSGDVSLGNAAGDTVLIAGTCAHTAPVTFHDDVTVEDPLTLSGDGRIRTRVTTGADADTTYNVNQYDEVHVVNGALSADRIYTIADGAAGEHIRITNHDIAKKITLKRADASSICELRSGFATLYGWVDLVWITRWEISAFYYHQ